MDVVLPKHKRPKSKYAATVIREINLRKHTSGEEVNIELFSVLTAIKENDSSRSYNSGIFYFVRDVELYVLHFNLHLRAVHHLYSIYSVCYQITF